MASLSKTFAALSLALTAFTASASADTYHHIDQLAVTIDRQAKQLLKESVHYRHTPEYAHLVSDARQLSQLADHMHEVAHHHGSLAHLESDLRQLDAEFHHIESLVTRIEWRAAHGFGHVHGHTSHVRRLLDSMEQNIHHLQDDLRQLRRPVHPVGGHAIYARPHASQWGGYNTYPRNNWGYNSRGSRSRGFGISIGGGSSRITIGF